LHELTIATTLVKSLQEFMQRQGQNQLLEVHVTVGKLRAISIEQLVFSYRILTENSALSESKLIIKETSATVNCPNCNYTTSFEQANDSYHFQLPSFSCPTCGTHLNLEGGDELLVTNVRLRKAAK